MEEKCKECKEQQRKEFCQKVELIKERYEEELKLKPSTTQIVAFGISCFALGVSLAKLFLK